MAYNSDTQSYDEYPNSAFPGKACDFPNMVDLSPTLRPIAEQYEAAYALNDTDTMNKLTQKYPDLEKSLHNAKKYNILLDEIKATQNFFTDEVDGMIHTVAANTVGINDAAINDEVKRTITYSGLKLDYMVGRTIATNISVLASEWVSDETQILPYKFVYSNDAILENDDVEICFADTSMLNASKAFIIVKSNSGAGNITLLARKIPASDLIIDTVKIVRN